MNKIKQFSRNICGIVEAVENASTEYYNNHRCQETGETTFIITLFL